MSNVLNTEIELDVVSLEVELEYDFTPGEKMVRYYRDGSGDPGCPPSADFVGAKVMQCDIDREQRRRCDHWIWRALDVIAAELINRDWSNYQEKCIEHENDMAERDWDE